MDEERAHADRRLGVRIDAGDMGALEEVYDAYSTAIYRQALAILACAADAEDVVQEVFLQLVRRRGYPIQNLKAYLLTAARHQACSTLRRRQREAGDPSEDEAPWPGSAGGLSDRMAVRQALEALPPEQQEVVRLKVYEQLTFAEISRSVRASVNTVASRYRYALEKLRKALGEPADVP
jgi:RNA polymerase sigma-70 factor (ECF subfamily)